MNTTKEFKKTIKAYLEEKAEQDELFAEKFRNKNKNINDCITYILNQVEKSGCNGFTDNEIYSIAIHYYDEEKINIGDDIQCNVVVNHTVTLTEEEKKKAREDAIKKYQNKIFEEMNTEISRPQKKKIEQKKQPTLF